MAEAKNGGKKVNGGRAADVIPMKWAKTMAEAALGQGRLSAALVISLGAGLGLRVSDVLRVTWTDIVDENGRARERVLVREHKNRTVRAVAPMPWARRVWEKAYATIKPADPSFPVVKMSRQRAWVLVKEMASECGYTGRISCHSLRKAFCSFLYDQTRDPVLTARLTGHRNPAHLLVYIGRSAPVEENIWRTIATMEI